MEALCNSRHSGEPSMKKEGLMPSPQYQADAGGGSGQKKDGNLGEREICEEEECLRVIVPLESPHSPNTV